MKIIFSLLLTQLACLVRGDVGWSEFGRQDRANANAPRRNRVIGLEAPVKSKPQKMIRREKSTSWSKEDRYEIVLCFFSFSLVILLSVTNRFIFISFMHSLEEMIDASRSTLELSMGMHSMSMSISMSMSMSMATSVPITIPTLSPVTSVPNPIPTPPPSPSATVPMGPPGPPTTTSPIQTSPPIPSFPPGPPTGEPGTPPPFLIPPMPTASSSEAQTPPTVSPSIEPTSEPTITNAPTGKFLPNSNCLSTSEIRLGDESDDSTTSVQLEIGYIAESYSSSVDGLMTELEEELIATAVFAIFGCNPDTSGISPTTLEILDGKYEYLEINCCI